MQIKDVLADLADGQLLAKLLEALSGQKYPGKLSAGLQRIQMLNQASEVLKWLEQTLKESVFFLFLCLFLFLFLFVCLFFFCLKCDFRWI